MPTHFAVVWNACLWTTSPAATVTVTATVEPLWGGRWELRGRRVEKRWRTTEKRQRRKDRNKEICRIMKQIRTPKIKKRIRE